MHKKEGSQAKEILVGALRFVALSLALLLIQRLLANTAAFESIRNAAYNLLQTRLAGATDPAHDIVVVDIGGIPRTPREDLPKQEAPTARAPLLALLTKLANSGVNAVGVDIDFSPEDDGNYVLPDDPEFFAQVQALSRETHVPIFLGVWRQAARGQENWLADKRFAALAAGLPVPRESAKRMPVYIHAGEGVKPLQTMAAAVASTQARLREQPPAWSLGLLDYRLENTPQPGLKVEEIAVDYSQLENLVETRLTWQAVMSGTDSGRLKGKLVLVGDALPEEPPSTDDRFQVPGRAAQFPGVYLHGSAAYSALKAPLYEFKEGAGARLDMIVGGVILALLVVFQIGLQKDLDRHPKVARLAFIAYYSIAVTLLIFGVWFVNVTRTMWDDFPIFIAALLIHHGSETLIEKRLHKHHVHPKLAASEIVVEPPPAEAPDSNPAPVDPPDSNKS